MFLFMVGDVLRHVNTGEVLIILNLADKPNYYFVNIFINNTGKTHKDEYQDIPLHISGGKWVRLTELDKALL